MSKRVLFGFLAVLLVVSSIMLSCKSAQTTTTTPTTTTTKTTTTTTTTPAAGQPKQGGTVRIPVPSGPAGFDAHRKASGVTYVSPLVFSNLVRQDPTKREVSMTSIVPDLAERWELSADGKTYTFYLAKNAKWHDGTACTADDVVYSIQKMMDPTRSIVFQTFSVVDQVVKVDDSTVKLVLKQPYAPLLVLLASPYYTIQAKSTANIDWKSTAFLMGTGPFMLKSYTSGVSIELVKNPNYFKKDKFGIQLPYLDTVQISIVSDELAATQALITNRLDISDPNGVRSDDNIKMMKDQAPTLVFDNAPTVLWPYILINPAGVAPLKDPRVRQAMVMLADQRSLLIATYGSDTAAYKYGNGIFKPTYGNPPEVINKIMGWDKSMEQRIIDAQQLMRDAGYYPKGFTVYMPAYGYPPIMNALSVLGETWKKYLNIDYTIKGMDPATFGQALMGKQFDVTLGELPAYMGEPDELRGYLTSGSPLNFISFSNATVDTLWQQQASEGDVVKRVAITQQIESAFLADHTAIPYPQMLGRYMWWPYVKGYVPSDAYLGIVLEYVWLDK